MCYPCTKCNACGKFTKGSPMYVAPPTIPCLECGGEVDGATGICTSCGAVAFTPMGTGASGKTFTPHEVVGTEAKR